MLSAWQSLLQFSSAPSQHSALWSGRLLTHKWMHSLLTASYVCCTSEFKTFQRRRNPHGLREKSFSGIAFIKPGKHTFFTLTQQSKDISYCIMYRKPCLNSNSTGIIQQCKSPTLSNSYYLVNDLKIDKNHGFFLWVCIITLCQQFTAPQGNKRLLKKNTLISGGKWINIKLEMLLWI